MHCNYTCTPRYQKACLLVVGNRVVVETWPCVEENGMAQAPVLGRDAIILLEGSQTTASPSISPGNAVCGKALQGFAPVNEPLFPPDTMVHWDTVRR